MYLNPLFPQSRDSVWMNRWMDRQMDTWMAERLTEAPNVLKSKVFLKVSKRINISYQNSQNKNYYYHLVIKSQCSLFLKRSMDNEGI